MIYSFELTDTDAGVRIDMLLTKKLPDTSRQMAKSLIEEGRVRQLDLSDDIHPDISENSLLQYYTDAHIIHKPSIKGLTGCKYLVDYPEAAEAEILAEDIKLDILYEDSDVIVINKPKGMVVHPDNTYKSGTLVNALMYHCMDLSGINGVMRPGIVHRIDMNTTGSVIACKNDHAHENIASQLKEHSINRIYFAITEGVIKEDEGVIDAPIGRNPNDRKKMAVNYKNGKKAVTHYKVIERFDKYTLIECRLETGRTHQIRVHLASKNHPIVGDEVYGKKETSKKLTELGVSGQCLHAKILGFCHPSDGRYVETDAPLPEYFIKVLEFLRK